MNVKTSLSEFECYNNKGEKIDSIEKHLKEREITFSDVLEVGDIIKRKNSNIFYKIQVVHYEILGVGYFDYAGNICNELGENDENNSNLYFFNQVDIDYKVNLCENRTR